MSTQTNTSVAFFTKITNDLQSFTIFTKKLYEVWLGSKYVSVFSLSQFTEIGWNTQIMQAQR